ncbi:protein of unknown function DUF4243 [Kalmanozyma brasiliensis GHG001]|uniref:HypA-like protein n=1 Tax=Kalmanozyma brasiliensis (strain GHG001) TaxID=1365824 RepID=V5F1I3_KALBG|nr:protein of unknown function DUF4243 [Kalmanozyma brasiliensis GHG001]EST09154.1 protein of unknown function DUF4243 [Kalmanozyma brasiliensis GHG001]
MSSTSPPTGVTIDPLTCRTSAFPELAPFIDPSSATTLANLLAENHASHHSFFNQKGMHNHSLHQLIADTTLKATPAQLERHYAYQQKHYLSSFSYNDRSKYDPHLSDTSGSGKGGSSITKISEGNWTAHLGDARYYWSYLHFFDRVVAQLGFREVLHRYVFSQEANEGEAKMIVRFYGGVIHALIHFGYGLEMVVKEVAAEGLAMAAATGASHAWLFELDWLKKGASVREEKKGLLELVREVQMDDRLSVDRLGLKEEESSLPDKPFEEGSGRGVIQEYVDRWAAIADGKIDLETAMSDLALLSALLLGAVPRQADGKAYKHDFFLMHLNNAHLFTSLYLDLFADSPQLQRTFLRALLAQFIYYYVCRGRPAFTTSNFITEHEASADLAWEQLFADARENVDEHLPKAVRALYVFEQRYTGSQGKLLESGLLQGGGQDWAGGEASVWKLTAMQLVRMHRGELQPSQYDSEAEREKGESIGSHQEFWSFEAFF